MESHPQPETAAPQPRVVLECPQCLNLCSPTDDECPACGFRFKAKQAAEPGPDRTIHFDPFAKKRYTDTVTVEIGTKGSSRHKVFWMLTNLALGLLAATIGVLMAYAMPFGFECGMIFVFVGALFILNVYLTSEGKHKRIDGSCPNCGSLCSMLIPRKRTTGTDICQKCSKPYRFDGTRFEEE